MHHSQMQWSINLNWLKGFRAPLDLSSDRRVSAKEVRWHQVKYPLSNDCLYVFALNQTKFPKQELACDMDFVILLTKEEVFKKLSLFK